MAVYTTLIKTICEQMSGRKEAVGLKDIAETVSLAIPKIFNFDYPIFDEAYRNVLETKIIRHYFYREIGLETVGQFLDRLDVKLNEIMPYYNQLYASIIKDFNPKYEMDYYKEGSKKDDNTELNSGTVSNHDSDTGTVNIDGNNTGNVDYTRTTKTEETPDNAVRTYFNDTPQGGITETLDASGYLTTYQRQTNTGYNVTDFTDDWKRLDNLHNESTQTSNLASDRLRTDNLRRKIDNTGEYTEHVYGIQNGHNYVTMITEFRNAIINIDMLIIEDLAELFMNIY